MSFDLSPRGGRHSQIVRGPICSRFREFWQLFRGVRVDIPLQCSAAEFVARVREVALFKSLGPERIGDTYVKSGVTHEMGRPLVDTSAGVRVRQAASDAFRLDARSGWNKGLHVRGNVRLSSGTAGPVVVLERRITGPMRAVLTFVLGLSLTVAIVGSITASTLEKRLDLLMGACGMGLGTLALISLVGMSQGWCYAAMLESWVRRMASDGGPVPSEST